jgi:aspartate/methionine/tyrosine aminotransferase
MMPPIAEITNLADKLENQGYSIIRSTGQGVPFIDPPNYALEALTGKWFYERSTHSYSPDPGYLEVREAVCDYLREDFSINAYSENLFLTAGSNMAFFMLITALLEPGHDEVILPLPYYFNHLMAVQIAGGKPVLVQSSKGFELDPEAITSKITDRTRAIVCVSPNNPSGAVFSINSLDALSTILKERDDIVLISDEPYANFTYGKNNHCSPASLPSLRKFTCTLGSGSKAFGIAGWRLGWLHLAPTTENLYETLLKIQDTTNIAPPSVSQKLLLAILRGPYKTYLEQVREKMQKNWEMVLAFVNSGKEIGIEYPQTPQGAFYLFPRIKGCEDTKKLAIELLKDQGVVTIPGIAFGEEGFLRISYGGKMEELKEAFTRIEKFLAKWKAE